MPLSDGRRAMLHLLCGKAGAGKTTLARELGRTLSAAVICEDEWIAKLGIDVRSIDDYRDASRRFCNLHEALVPDLLRKGQSVVLDFAANTVERRRWARSLAEAAGADHLLHWIDASDGECLANVHRRNDEKPAGVYFGDVSDELFHAVMPYFVAPGPDEGLNVIHRPPRSRG
jgi:predicted kinase